MNFETELAEYVLNKSIKMKNDGGIDQPAAGTGEPPLHEYTPVTYDFQCLDDFLPEGVSEDNQVIYYT